MAKKPKEVRLRMKCPKCGWGEVNLLYGMSASSSDCESCGTHGGIVVTCPKCSKAYKIYDW